MIRYWSKWQKGRHRGPLFFAGFLAISLPFFDVSNTSTNFGKVEKRTIEQRVTIAGSIEPLRNTIITPPYAGFIKKLFVKIGQNVKAGDPLVAIAQSLQSQENTYPLRAPFAGRVVQLLKTEGQFVKDGDAKDYILRVDDLSQMFVYANAPEFDIPKIKPGMEVTVRATALRDRSYKGVVREIAHAATPRDGWVRSQVDYVVKIEITNVDESLKSGMSAIVDIITAKKSDVLSLSYEYIKREQDSFFVTLKDRSRKKIEVGIRNESAIEIVSGLSEGDEVRQVDLLEDAESL